MILIGFMMGDLCVLCLLVRDFTSGSAKQTFLHHVLALIGSFSGIYVGRFIGTMSSVTLVTELTTPLVNNHVLLMHHGKTGGMSFVINGLSMTIGFFVVRCCLQSYLVLFKGVTAL